MRKLIKLSPEKERLCNGILTIIGCTLIHFSLGYFYTISNMTPYIISYIKKYVDSNVKTHETIWLPAIGLGIQGIIMPFGGIVAKKAGFRVVIAICCIVQSASVMITYVTIQRTYIGVLMSYSFMMGLGIGFGYSVILSTATSWFPARRAIVVGIVVCGFGLGSFVFTPIQTAMINPQNVRIDNVTRLFTDSEVLDRIPKTFLILGAALLGIQIVGFLLLRQLPKAPVSVGSSAQESSRLEPAVNSNDVPPKQLLRRIDFYLLWIVMFCDIIPITVVLSSYKLFGQTFIADDLFLSSVATASSLTNSAGRIIWGAIIDKISFKSPMCLSLLIWAALLFTFPHISQATGVTAKALQAVWVCLIFFTHSSVFVCMPAATATLFGPKNLAANYGMLFFAFALGSVICAVFTAYVKVPNSYVFQYTACACVCLAALFTAWWIRDPKIPPKWDFYRKCTKTCPRLRGPVPESIGEDEGAHDMGPHFVPYESEFQNVESKNKS